jgi:glutamyl-tRNA synthetase
MGASTPSTPNPSVVTRFAPSPTGFLHIGGARTALFNYLFARHHGGQFRLRIEDTDRARSTEPAVAAILDGLSWLGLEPDGEIVYQFSRAARHAEVAHQLLASGHAYRCYATAQELEEMRDKARAEKRPIRYDGRWRDRTDAPADQPFVIRLKAPQTGDVTIHDKVQGSVTVANAELDDMVLLRSDGSPTYMLAVVVDDHDMGVTHVIRGDDHLNNAFRQLALIRALQWPEPVYAHIPLIHGTDGAKLSKRHGALGVDAYRDEMGVLPEALENYLLRLGWGHGDDEFISREQAIAWFSLDAVGRSPSRFDAKKLESVGGHYLRAANDARLARLVAPRIEASLGRPLTPPDHDLLHRTMPELKKRAPDLNNLAASALFYLRSRPIPMDDAAQKLLASAPSGLLARARAALADASPWQAAPLEQAARGLADTEGLKLGQVAQPLRAALTGAAQSPGLFEVMEALGRDQSLGRLDDAISLHTDKNHETERV